MGWMLDLKPEILHINGQAVTRVFGERNPKSNQLISCSCLVLFTLLPNLKEIHSYILEISCVSLSDKVLDAYWLLQKADD